MHNFIGDLYMCFILLLLWLLLSWSCLNFSERELKKKSMDVEQEAQIILQ